MDGLSVAQVTEQIDRQHEQQRLASIEVRLYFSLPLAALGLTMEQTLENIFPQLEREVLEMVLLSNASNMSSTIDSLLEMS